MHRIAEDVWHVPLSPRDGVNAYVIGDVLVDAGYAMMGKRAASSVADRAIAAHTITHAHPDHVGGSKKVVDALGVPFWAPVNDAAAIEAGKAVIGATRLKPLMGPAMRLPKVPIARKLVEGDEVGGFRVLDVPGHSPGHIAFWRESDRVLLCGDVWFNMNVLTTAPGLRDPLTIATPDPDENHRSQRRLADLEPAIVGFGHGPVMHDAAPKLRAFVDGR